MSENNKQKCKKCGHDKESHFIADGKDKKVQGCWDCRDEFNQNKSDDYYKMWHDFET